MKEIFGIFRTKIYGPYIVSGTFITYSELLELSIFLSFLGLWCWKYFSYHGTPKTRLVSSLGFSLVVFGIIFAVTVWAETQFTWGHLWYGIRIWNGFPDGSGYPWGIEQVTYNSCLIKAITYTIQTQDCIFLNYDEVIYGSLIAVVAGFVMRRISLSKRSDW